MNEGQVRAVGYDDCIIGVEYHTGRAVYSIEKVTEQLIDQSQMTYDEAIEFFSFNIGGAFVGEMTPLYVWTERIEDE